MSNLKPIMFKNSSTRTTKKKSVFSAEPVKPIEPIKSEEEILEIIKKKAYEDAYQVGLEDAKAEVAIVVENKEAELDNLINTLNNELKQTRDLFISRNTEILKHVLNSIIGNYILINEEIMTGILGDALSEFKNDEYMVAVSPSVNLSGDSIIIDEGIAEGCLKVIGSDKNINIDIRTVLQKQLSKAMAIISND